LKCVYKSIFKNDNKYLDSLWIVKSYLDNYNNVIKGGKVEIIKFKPLHSKHCWVV